MSILLATKFHRPAPPLKPVQRPRLVQRLNDGLASGRLLTLVSAPAGFGKTTCVRGWIDGQDLPVSWLSLDPLDDEPGRFFTYIITALQNVDTGLGQEIAGVLRSGQVPPPDVISASLINDLLQRGQPFLLVLDDLQVIQDPVILQALERLVSGLAQASTLALHLVLVTREDPPLPLARLRANNRVTEVRAGDLRFSMQEAASFLNQVMGLGLSEADIAALEERTEGWIVGLQLAALALQSLDTEAGQPALSDKSAAFITALNGSRRHILSYLAEEVLSRQPEDIQRFLLDTCILEALNGDLCDTVTGRSGSRVLLEQLYQSNLFLVPLDDAQVWYRYHHLFAGLLRERLKDEGKDHIAEMQRRASRWYASCEPIQASEAIHHALAAGDYPFAVSLIENHAMDMLMQWQTRVVTAWMEALPPEWAAQSPKTNLAFAWLHLMGGNPVQAVPYLDRLQPLFLDRGVPDTTQKAQPDPSLKAEWLALQSMLLNAQGKPAESLALAQQALEMLPPQPGHAALVHAQPGAFDRTGYVLSMIYVDLAGAYQQMEDDARAMEVYQKIIQHGQAADDLFSELMGISALGLLALHHGMLHFAYELTSRGEERVKRFGGTPPISQAVYGELGEVYYEWNDIARARAYFERSVHASALSGYPDAGVYNTVFRARLLLIEGDLDAAASEIEKAVDQARAISPTAVREEVVVEQVRIALAQDRLAAAEAALARPDLGPVPDLTAGQPLSFPQGELIICALRIFLHRARARGDLACLGDGISLANQLIDAVIQRQYIPLAITALILRGQMHITSGSAVAARVDFIQALELGEREGFITIFVEEGPPVAEALAGLLASRQLGKVQPAYIEKILSAFPNAPSAGGAIREAASSPGLIEPLTGRELEVLRLIAEGLKYEEVAGRLFISLNTVRTYVKEIYSKLGVNNRSRAVALARQHGLI